MNKREIYNFRKIHQVDSDKGKKWCVKTQSYIAWYPKHTSKTWTIEKVIALENKITLQTVKELLPTEVKNFKLNSSEL